MNSIWILADLPMAILHGKSISPGYADGTVVLYDRALERPIPQYGIGNHEIETEHERFHQALMRSARDLNRVRQRVLADLGQAESRIFSAHLALLRDQRFIEKVKDRVSSELINVEQALDTEVTDFANLLSSLESEFLRERIQDINDVKHRVLRHLAKEKPKRLRRLKPKSVIVAAELTPSDTVNLDRSRVAAFVTERGGQTSHAAILAKAMGVPAVTAVRDITRQVSAGERILVDGRAGVIVIAPTEEEGNTFLSKMAKYDESLIEVIRSEREICTTEDGEVVHLYGNIGRPGEVEDVKQHYLDAPNSQDVTVDTTDGIRIDLPDAWVQLRASNTEPIMRITAESPTSQRTQDLIQQMRSLIPA